MIIGIDGNEANVEHQVGVSVYTKNLLDFFQKKSTKEIQFRVYLREEAHLSMPSETEFFKYVVVKGKFMWSQIYLPLHLNLKKEIDIFFAPAHYSPRFCPVPLVVTIHDLAYLYFPQEFLKKDLYKLENWTKYSVTKAKHIIAVSKSTKKDLMKEYNLPEEKIQVIYNGFEKETSNLQPHTLNILQTHELEKEKYVLYVGTIQPRKNIRFLIQAFKKFHDKSPEYKLVLTGKKGWLYEQIYEEVDKQNLQDSVIFTGYIPDEDVIELYKNAFCFVFPSLYEGFGIPLLEAMSYNCPVISSFAASLAEVGGDACMYFDPKTDRDLIDDLLSLKDNPKLRNELIEKGQERIKNFSWQKCAEETLEAIMKIQK